MQGALVHDLLVQRGGAEKVLEALSEIMEGPIYTLLKSEKGSLPFSHKEIHTSFLQKVPQSSRIYKGLLPFFPSAIQRLDLSSHSLIVSSSFMVAKSIVKRPDQLHICYCHTPFRPAWDFQEFYLSKCNRVSRMLAEPVLRYLQAFDLKTNGGVDHFVANSRYVAARIWNHYKREAKVIHPPVEVERFYMGKKRGGYFLTCSRLVPYKRVDLLVEAFAQLSDRKLVVVGEGSQLREFRAKAPKNVSFLGYVTKEKLAQLYSEARAFLYAAEEDFGIVMAEAQAASLPVIAYGKGGSKEIVLGEKTGLFFQEQRVASIIEAILQFEKREGDFDPNYIRAHAQSFSKERFLREFSDFVHLKKGEGQ